MIQIELHIRKCNNITCRVETYAAADNYAMSGCPVCTLVGVKVVTKIEMRKDEHHNTP